MRPRRESSGARRVAAACRSGCATGGSAGGSGPGVARAAPRSELDSQRQARHGRQLEQTLVPNSPQRRSRLEKRCGGPERRYYTEPGVHYRDAQRCATLPRTCKAVAHAQVHSRRPGAPAVILIPIDVSRAAYGAVTLQLIAGPDREPDEKNPLYQGQGSTAHSLERPERGPMTPQARAPSYADHVPAVQRPRDPPSSPVTLGERHHVRCRQRARIWSLPPQGHLRFQAPGAPPAVAEGSGNLSPLVAGRLQLDP